MRLEFLNISFIYTQLSLITIVMQTETKFWHCFTKVNIKFFHDALVLSLIPSVTPSPNTEKLFFHYEMKNYYKHQK